MSRAKNHVKRAMWAIFAMALIPLYNNCGAGFQTAAPRSIASDALNFPPLTGSSGEKVFACSDTSTFSVAETRRLTKTQYENSIKALLGPAALASVATLVEDIPFDLAIEQPTEFANNFYQSTVDTFLPVADQLAGFVLGDVALQTKIGGNCLATAEPDAACFDSLVANFGAKVFRRPLSGTEISTIRSLATTGTKAEKITNLFEYVFQSPDFLYRIEAGTGGDGTLASPFRLSSYEIASRLSFQIWDSMPDDTLFALAAQDKLLDPAVVRQQVDRMFESPLAAEKLKIFTKFWLAMNNTPHSMKNFPVSPAAFIGDLQTTGYKDEVIRETQEFVNHVVFKKGGSYRDLMTSPESFARTDALASVYGHAKVTGSAPAQMANGRKGLLMRPIFLAGTSSLTSPVIRGVRARSRVLCMDTNPPSTQILEQGPDISTAAMIQMHSTRERWTLKTNQPACIGCHATFNSYGFVFEGFDSFGRQRSQEVNYNADGSILATHAIDTTGSIVTPEGTWQVNGPEQFVEDLGESTSGPACMTKQIHRYYHLSAETKEDSCALAKAFDGLKGDGSQPGSVLEALKRSIASDYIGLKRVK